MGLDTAPIEPERDCPLERRNVIGERPHRRRVVVCAAEYLTRRATGVGSSHDAIESSVLSGSAPSTNAVDAPIKCGPDLPVKRLGLQRLGRTADHTIVYRTANLRAIAIRRS